MYLLLFSDNTEDPVVVVEHVPQHQEGEKDTLIGKSDHEKEQNGPILHSTGTESDKSYEQQVDEDTNLQNGDTRYLDSNEFLDNSNENSINHSLANTGSATWYSIK